MLKAVLVAALFAILQGVVISALIVSSSSKESGDSGLYIQPKRIILLRGASRLFCFIGNTAEALYIRTAQPV